MYLQLDLTAMRFWETLYVCNWLDSIVS